MNIEKIFASVESDEMNSPLVSIIYELENQGYKVKLAGVDVKSDDLEATIFNDFEKSTNEFEFEIIDNFNINQKFKIVFTDYHRFSFHSINNH